MSTFRGAELYVQGRTKRRLRWIVKAIGTPELTADQFADQILNQVIEERWPQVKELEDEYEAAEARLQGVLKGQWQG